ncbi:glycosyltransferase family 2 protein [Vibrio harveyi]|nr:glycosyltransferase family 2 protein [Vibrio harveyi]
MSNKPYFSILLSVYNGSAYIESCLDAIFNQSFKDWELILIDDGSSDNLKEIISKNKYDDSRIKYFHKENSGLTQSLNFGINKCKGLWIVRQDVDDISLPNRLQVLRDAILESECRFFYSQARVYDFKTNNVRITPRKAFQHGFGLNVLRFGNYIAHGTIAIEAELIKEVKYNEKHKVAQDFGLYVELAKLGIKGHMIPIPLYELNKVPDSISEKKLQLQLSTVSEIIKETYSNDRYFILNKLFFKRMVLLFLREVTLLKCRLMR